jgi:DNA-binding response OmpR family regulator
VLESGKGHDAEVNRGLSMGADLYVTKPFSTPDLVDGINALLQPT